MSGNDVAQLRISGSWQAMGSSLRFTAITLVSTSLIGCATLPHGNTGSFTGRLIDPNSTVVTGLEATVHLKNTATGETQSVALSMDGYFAFAGLAPGNYDLNIPIACCMYGSYEQKSVTIAARQALKADFNVTWGINLGTIGDDPTMLGADMRARAAKVVDMTAPAPRMPDGKPDLSGMWYNIRVQPGYPAPPPMQKWAEDMQKELNRINQQGPALYCLPQSAIPTTLPFPYKFVQTGDLIVHITEFTTPGYRQIFLDGRPHPPAEEWNPAWYGHSVGHWDGDALVIDSIGFNEITPGFGVHTEKLHIVERIRRRNLGTLEVEITATDPDAFTGEYKFNFSAGYVPTEEILEFVCPENNLDALHNGQPWRGRP